MNRTTKDRDGEQFTKRQKESPTEGRPRRVKVPPQSESEGGRVKDAQVNATMTSEAKSEVKEAEAGEGEIPKRIKEELKRRAEEEGTLTFLDNIIEHVKEVALSHVQRMDKEDLRGKIEEGGRDEELTLKIDLTPYIDSIFK